MSRTGPVADDVAALAGVFQAVRLVDTLALEGTADSAALATVIASIHTLDADDVAGCYGGSLDGLATGRDALHNALVENHGQQRILRYAFTLMSLERRLQRRPAMREQIASTIRSLDTQVRHLGPTHDQVIARFADLYAATVSQLKPRVLVRGAPLYLQQERIVQRIRALLLGGIRSAVLWQQRGGARWHFLFRRGALLRELAAWRSDAVAPDPT